MSYFVCKNAKIEAVFENGKKHIVYTTLLSCGENWGDEVFFPDKICELVNSTDYHGDIDPLKYGEIQSFEIIEADDWVGIDG